MKILHLFSDWRWTGPAEPVVQMCLSLQKRGHEVLLAYRKEQSADNKTIAKKIKHMGVNGTTRFNLDRYMNPWNTLYDLWHLPGFLRKEKFDIVHMHLSHDHVFGSTCAKLLGKNRPLLVRTLHRREGLKPTFGYRILLRHLTDGNMMFTKKFQEEYIRRFDMDPACTAVQPMTIDLDRFSPDKRYKDMRAEFDIPSDAPLIGIVGRFQRYRRMGTFLEAARRVLQNRPETRFLVIGGSSQIQETVAKPINELGISGRVILAGYRFDDYLDTLACLDIFSLLMPGSDGTARAVREALALGKPCVVSDVGMLPEIVDHGSTGLVVDDDPELLSQAWLKLIQDQTLRENMGYAARQYALERFNSDAVGIALEEFYGRIISQKSSRQAGIT